MVGLQEKLIQLTLHHAWNKEELKIVMEVVAMEIISV